MLVVDLLHEFELGVWKAIFTQLLRILYAAGDDKIQHLNKRQVDPREHHNDTQFSTQVPQNTTIRRYYQTIRK